MIDYKYIYTNFIVSCFNISSNCYFCVNFNLNLIFDLEFLIRIDFFYFMNEK